MRHRMRPAMAVLLLGGCLVSAAATAPLAAAAPVPPASTDVAECADGTCRVLVTTGTVIPLDPGLGADELRVAVGRGLVTVVAQGPTSRSSVTTSAGGVGVLNAVVFEIERVDGDTAVLSLRPL